MDLPIVQRSAAKESIASFGPRRHRQGLPDAIDPSQFDD
jgi:hypothetical protein